MPADPNVKFTLTINYSGGHQPSQSWDFNVQFGLNGSFESGDFSGWNVSTVSTGGVGTSFYRGSRDEARGRGGLRLRDRPPYRQVCPLISRGSGCSTLRSESPL